MATTTLIISPAYLKANSILDENIESEKIVPNIKKSQDRYIWTALGTDLYNKILNDISGGTLTGNYKVLVDEYVIPCLTEFAVYETLPYIHFNLTNKSIEVKSGENQEPVEREDLIYLRDNIQSMAEWYLKRLVDYLCFNNSLFSELNTNEGDELSPSNKAYTSSIYFPKR